MGLGKRLKTISTSVASRAIDAVPAVEKPLLVGYKHLSSLERAVKRSTDSVNNKNGSVIRAEEFLEKLGVDNDIDGVSRILVASLVLYNPNGDGWYTLQRAPVYEKLNNCKLVFFVDPSKRQMIEEKVKVLEYDNYKYEFIDFPTDFPTPVGYKRDTSPIYYNNPAFDYLIFRAQTNRVRSIYTYEGVPAGQSQFADFFRNRLNSSWRSGVRKPRVTQIDRNRYVREYGIIPGRTFLLVPDSRFVPSYPPEYWNLVAAVLRNAGFAVVFNSMDERFDGPKLLPPWSDVLGVVELCGHVYGIMSGFFDYAIDAKAQFTIISPSIYVGWLDKTHFGGPQDNIHWIDTGARLQRKPLLDMQAAARLSVNFVEWVFNLSQHLGDKIVFVVTRDSHCSLKARQSDQRLRVMKLLGLRYPIESTPRTSYVAVVDGGEVVAEKASHKHSVHFEYRFNKSHVAKLSSYGWNAAHGTKLDSRVFIDDVNYSMNRRGLNFVVWSKRENKLIESICFDTFSELPLADFEPDDRAPGAIGENVAGESYALDRLTRR